MVEIVGWMANKSWRQTEGKLMTNSLLNLQVALDATDATVLQWNLIKGGTILSILFEL